MPKFSSITELSSSTRQTENAMCYELSTWNMEAISCISAASPEPGNGGSQPAIEYEDEDKSVFEYSTDKSICEY